MCNDDELNGNNFRTGFGVRLKRDGRDSEAVVRGDQAQLVRTADDQCKCGPVDCRDRESSNCNRESIRCQKNCFTCKANNLTE